MTENKSNQSSDDQDIIMKSQMERMVDSYDLYMKRITLGREKAKQAKLDVTFQLGNIEDIPFTA